MEEIKGVIDNYLIAQNTDYAIMINGEWGCGKTYFVQQVLFDHINKNDLYGIKYECVYVSLYGLDCVDDIGERIFFAINKNYKWIGLVSKRFASFASAIPIVGDGIKSSLELDDNEKNKIHEKLSNLSNKVIFFDDLERISKNVNLEEVLGFINNYSENEKYKTVIICNKEKIDSDVYKKFIEKTVRYVVKYDPDINVVYDELVSVTNLNNKFREYIKEKKTEVIEILICSKYKNLRTIKFIYESMSVLYAKMANILVEDNKYLNSIFDKFITYYVVYSLEYKKGCDEKKLSTLTNLRFAYLVKNREDYENDEFYKYNDIAYDINYNPTIEKYIRNGYIDDPEFNDFVSTLLSEVKRQEDTVESMMFKKITNWNLIEDNELDELIEKITDAVKSDKYDTFELIKIYTCFARLESMGFVDQNLCKTSLNIFINAIDSAFERCSSHINLSYHFGYEMDSDSDDIKEKYRPLIKHTREIYGKRESSNERNKIGRIIYCIQNKDQDGILECMSFENRERFTMVNVNTLSDVLIKADKDIKQVFRHGIYRMYPDNLINPDVSENVKIFLSKLKTNISNHLNAKQKKLLSDRYLIMLVNDIDKRIKEYFPTVN